MCLLLLLIIFQACTGFNLDAENAEIFKNPVDGNSYFGYSVALYPSGKNSVLLVGAPRANSSRPSDARVVEPGAVYWCRINEGECAEWLIDGVLKNRDYEIKDHAWLGGSISTQNSTDPKVVVCAPGWKKKDTNKNGYEAWFMKGMCYSTIIKDSSVFNQTDARRHLPFISSQPTIETALGRFYNYGMAQVGFSAHLTPDHGNLVLGAPGVLHWCGSAVLLNETAQKNPYEVGLTPYIRYDYNFKYEDYFGYSVTSGYFYDLGKRIYAAGAPRGANTYGKVVIFDFLNSSQAKLLIKSTLKGEQSGEYFGSSLTSCDINNDGRDDLVVGAPQWSTRFDEGRVYVFISTGHFRFDRQRINGEPERGRFGTSVVCLGDLDYDGHADVAVGAPYEDDQGVVYIFSGSPNGLIQTQKIRARDVDDKLQGFGFSIAEPRDVDGNGYGDLAVGAYLSGHAVLIKAKPTITLNLKMHLVPSNFKLTLNSTNFTVEACLVYDGTLIPETYEVIVEFEIDKIHKRGFVYLEGQLYSTIYKVQIDLHKGNQKCTYVRVNLEKNIQNVIDPIEIDAQVYVNQKSFCENCPIVNPKISKTKVNFKLNYTLEVCGFDNICTSDLQVNLTSKFGTNDTFIIGSKSKFDITINVQNTLEPAYKAQLHIYLPQPIVLAKKLPECDKKAEINNFTEVICNIGNPLLDYKTITISLDLSEVQYSDKFKDVIVNVITQSQEKNLFNNNQTLRIKFDIDASLGIYGNSYDKTYSFFKNEATNRKIKTFSLNHVYEIWKLGISPIKEVTFIINMPMQVKNTKVAKITRIHGSSDEKNFTCENVKMNDASSSLSVPTTSKRKTLFVDCTHSPCQEIHCDIGPFDSDRSMAKVIVTIDFLFSNAIDELMENKDTIFYTSEGYIEILELSKIIKLNNTKTTKAKISTKISIRSDPVISVWIFVFSIVSGILLLLIISAVFNKFGFFDRQKNEELMVLDSSEMVNQDTYYHQDSEISETVTVDEFL